jgi:hypothetical protein
MEGSRQSQLKAELVEKAMRIVWASLESHLEFTYKKHVNSKKFHKQTIREYADLLSILSRLY